MRASPSPRVSGASLLNTKAPAPAREYPKQQTTTYARRTWP